MKLALVLIALSLVAMAGMIFVAVNQEVKLFQLKDRMTHSSADTKTKEQAMFSAKAEVQRLREKLAALNSKLEELHNKKSGLEKSMQEADGNLQKCNTDKAEAEKNNNEMTESLKKMKDEHEEAKKKAQEEIQTLKQQILDRNKAICALVDATNEEARKVCGITEAPK